MARQLRIEYEGAFYHITSRGNQRDSIFWDNRDRKNFLTILKRTKKIERLRKITIYLIKEMSVKKNIEIGKIFGITGQAVTNVIRQMDKMIEKNENIRKEIEEMKGIIRNM